MGSDLDLEADASPDEGVVPYQARRHGRKTASPLRQVAPARSRAVKGSCSTKGYVCTNVLTKQAWPGYEVLYSDEPWIEPSCRPVAKPAKLVGRRSHHARRRAAAVGAADGAGRCQASPVPSPSPSPGPQPSQKKPKKTRPDGLSASRPRCDAAGEATREAPAARDEGKEAKDAREARDPREPREAKAPREAREARELKGPQRLRDPREPRETTRDPRDPREARAPRSARYVGDGQETQGELGEKGQEDEQEVIKTQVVTSRYLTAAIDNHLRRSQSSPGGRSSPTWQVPLQTDLSKVGNNDEDDWKGPLKENVCFDAGPVKGPLKPEAESGEANKTYGRAADADLDLDAGNDDDIRPSPGRCRSTTRPGRLQAVDKADALESKSTVGIRASTPGPAAGKPCYYTATQRQAAPEKGPEWRSDAATAEAEAESWTSGLKQRRRARTLGPSLGGSERVEVSQRAWEREPSTDRGALRSTRRTLPNTSTGEGGGPRIRGSSPPIGASRDFGDRISGDRGFGNRGFGDRGFGDRGFGDRGFGDCGFGDRGIRNRGFGERGVCDRSVGAWERSEDRATSRLRGRSEDVSALQRHSEGNILARAVSQFALEERLTRPLCKIHNYDEPLGSPFGDHLATKRLPTWKVEGPKGVITDTHDAPNESFDSGCEAVPEDLDVDHNVPSGVRGQRFYKATNCAATVDSLGGTAGRSRPNKLRREVRCLLNKISPDNEAQITSQLAGLQLEEAEDFKTVAKATIEKAMNDPFYSEVYACAISKLTLEFSSLPIIPRQGPSNSDSESSDSESLTGAWCPRSSAGFCNFSDAVLNYCKRTFDKLFSRSETLEDPTVGEDPDTGATAKDRALAFMRMLGHLHKVGIVSTAPLQQCMDRLLLSGAERSQDSHTPLWPPKAWIECACEFLTIIGKDLSRTTKGKLILKAATERLERLKAVSGHTYPPRIHFLVQDIIEASGQNFPSIPFDAKGGPSKARCKVPVRMASPLA